MAVYMISYDIKVADSFEYPKLYEAIQNLAISYCRPLQSVWFVDTTTLSSENIKEILTPHLTVLGAESDFLIVLRCTSDIAGYCDQDYIDWIHSPDRTWNDSTY